ncbi:ABC transporter permease [Gluconacetobacter azotocaptans]|uniref:ABC transporter permease n=2 Tax=Gluconacetobacter azotocaptans TaxID=142834 RepID=A0A7W4PHT5_9PROT|nr:ABC transporter permease [Gluconacetobacter azotocaptans]MBB2191446.1 ABC transporter permease [Gluconacetobacter azotocaptans]MBM9402783.1 ABC transporter permease [Gluconacetobacter azotocaptans]GBQ29645.1 dipeptide/oligopeptide/nickel ABC transporter permease [Gluconacetobacter azotocaptans DSM 13594]
MPSLTARRVSPAARFFSHSPTTGIAAGGTLMLAFLALTAPWISPYDPLASDVPHALQAPGPHHWFGTDELGRDVLSRVLAAGRLDLTIAVSAVSLSLAAGVTVGCFCGYLGGRLDRLVGRVVDVLTAFPLFVLAMALVAALGNSVENLIYATAIINFPFYIRVARAEVAARRHLGWVEAAHLSGNGTSRIVIAFLLPNILPTVAIQASLNLGWAILNAAGLSFLGLGITVPTPEWGVMVANGAHFMSSGRWWLVLFPGSVLMLTILCFNLLGDGLRDLLDPRTRT